VTTLCETYLRPCATVRMSYVDKDTLVVCFLSSDPTIRAYELICFANWTRKNSDF